MQHLLDERATPGEEIPKGHIAATHRGTRVLALIDEATVTTIALDTGEILATHTINPARNYWPNTQKKPGRWPSSS